MKYFFSIRLFLICLIAPFLFFSCGGDNNDDPDTPLTPENLITGNTWYSEYISSRITSYNLLSFKKDGTFTRYNVDKVADLSPDWYTESGTYTIEGENIYLNLNNRIYTDKFTINAGVLKLSGDKYDDKYYTSSLKNLDGIVVGRSYMEMDPVEDIVVNSPYKNFMYGWYSGTHCYKELSKVEMQCEHGFNGEANWKYLRFCGTNGNVSPDGALVVYSRPNYEGIDKYWADGTYKINRGGGYYTYAIHPYFNGRDYISSEDEGTLTIKSNGKYKVFDYKSDDLRIHFEGTFID